MSNTYVNEHTGNTVFDENDVIGNTVDRVVNNHLTTNIKATLSKSKSNHFYTILHRCCDTVENFTLSIKLPNLPENRGYVYDIEKLLVSKITLTIGGLVAQNFDGDYLFATKNISRRIGNIVYVHVPFAFAVHDTYYNGLPIISLQYHEARFELFTRPLHELIFGGDLTDIELSSDDIELNIGSNYYEKNIRRKIAQLPHDLTLSYVATIKEDLVFEDKKSVIKEIPLSHYGIHNCSGIIVAITDKKLYPYTYTNTYHKLITDVRIETKIFSKQDPCKLTYDANILSMNDLNKKMYDLDLHDGTYYIPFSRDSHSNVNHSGLNLNKSGSTLFLTCEKKNLYLDDYLISLYCITTKNASIKDGGMFFI